MFSVQCALLTAIPEPFKEDFFYHLMLSISYPTIELFKEDFSLFNVKYVLSYDRAVQGGFFII